MKTKIRVHGKSQSRTVLGIINAYLKLNPDSTLSDLRQIFIKALTHHSNPESFIVPEKETQGREKQYFEREDEQVVLKNGEKLALYEIWNKEDYDALCEHAKQYGIVVAEKKEAKPFEKGSFHLEYLDQKCKCKCSWWWWILLLILLLLIIVFWCKCCCSDKCSSPNVAPIETITPAENSLISDTGDSISFTLPDGTVWTIGKNSAEFKLFTFLNSDDVQVDADKTKGWITLDKAHFDIGKANLDLESEIQLKGVAMILKFFPNSQIKVGGYTDNTGANKLNMKLSAERAKAAADKLTSLGIAADRIAHEGYGSKHPVCQANNTDDCKAANRRVDVRVTQK